MSPGKSYVRSLVSAQSSLLTMAQLRHVRSALEQIQCCRVGPVKPWSEEGTDQDNAKHQHNESNSIRARQRNWIIFFILIRHAIEIHILHHVQVVIYADDRINNADDNQPCIASLYARCKD